MCVCVSCSVVSDSFNPMDCSPPDFSVHGILQARILEWIAIPFSRGFSHPRDWTQADSLTSEPPEKLTGMLFLYFLYTQLMWYGFSIMTQTRQGHSASRLRLQPLEFLIIFPVIPMIVILDALGLRRLTIQTLLFILRTGWETDRGLLYRVITGGAGSGWQSGPGAKYLSFQNFNFYPFHSRHTYWKGLWVAYRVEAEESQNPEDKLRLKREGASHARTVVRNTSPVHYSSGCQSVVLRWPASALPKSC